ncbi:MAG: Smr/MutS family protein [Saprospiraceae bacterium]|nr:Smr/MutS family protein [Saprospiraceae bacterium]
MLFSVGTRVRFKHTKDLGTVTALLDGNMVSVQLEDEDLEIPAFVDDLIRAEDYFDANPSVKAKIVPGKKKKVIKPPERPDAEQQYLIIKSLGIQLAFDPIVRPDGITEKYEIYLINDTPYDALVRFTLYLAGRMKFRHDAKLESVSMHHLGELEFDELNEQPVFECQVWKITTLGTGSEMNKTIKIKPKQFFKNIRTAPILNKQCHHYRVFDKLKADETVTDKRKEDLKTYTKRNARPVSSMETPLRKVRYDISELSEFVNEIDLHIEKLHDNPRKLDNGQILRIQLAHFEQYINKALRLGVDRVFVIHGVGEGRLKNAIATRLIQMPHIKSFKNEYHPRYGYGATEVLF